MIQLKTFILLTCLLFWGFAAKAQLSLELLAKPEQWYASDEALHIADNILLFQRNVGGWPKEWPLGKDYFKEYSLAEKEHIYNQNYREDCTFDNGATHTELRFLAKVYTATKKTVYHLGFLRGFDFVIKAQYQNGGWPQYYPGSQKVWDPGISRWSPDGIAGFITFNDDAMTRVLWLLKDISENHRDFSFLDDARRIKAKEAVNRGIDCILKSQVVYDGALTAWPAQADEVTFEPRWGRSFEPASITANESVTIIRVLMSIDQPGQEIIQAIQGGVKWLENVKILNTRVVKRRETFTIGKRSGRRDVYIEHDPDAPPVWARFYELNTFRPVFCSRGDSLKYKLSEISLERRSAYAWYGTWPEKLLSVEYPEWCRIQNVENIIARSVSGQE